MSVSLRTRRIRNIAADLTLGALMPLAATAVLAGQRVLGTAVLGVCLLVLATRWWQERRRLEFRWDVLGGYRDLRGLATACVAAVAVGPARAAADIVGAVVAAAVLATLLVLEPKLKSQAEATVPVVVNLPGVPQVRQRHVSQLAMLVLHSLAVVAGLVLAALGLPAWVWAAVSLVPLGYAVRIAAEGVRRERVGRQVMAAAPAAVAAYAPEIVLHTAHMGPNYHQAMMWLPYLQRTGLRTMVLTRYPGPSNALRDRVGDVPLVQAQELTDLDAVLVPSIKAVFYPNAKLGNSTMIRRYPWVRHVFLGHGDSDKSTSYAPSHAVYDTIFAAGPAAIRRYADHGVLIAPEKFEVVGRPQVEDVAPARGPVGELVAPAVLYAPTWKGFTSETSLSSVSLGVRIVTALLRTRATVIFRPHPSSYNFVRDRVHIAAIHELLAADAARTGRAHLFGPAADTELDSIGCMNRADAMVSDVSGVASDFLFSGKPLAMVSVGTEVDDFVRRFPVSRGSYVIERDLGNIDDLLEQMLGADPMQQRRAEIRADYLGDFPTQGYAAGFANAARRAGTTDKQGAERPVAATAKAAADTRAKPRPTTLRARLGLVRRATEARLSELPGWAWFAALLLASGALAYGLAGSRLLTAVLVLLTTVLLVRVPVELRAPRTLFRLVGEDGVARALLVVAVLAAITRPEGLTAGPALLACGLGAALASERLARSWSEQWPLTRNLPGLRGGRGEPYPGVLVVLTALVELLVLALPRPAVIVVAGVVLLLAAVAVAVMALSRAGSGKAVDTAWRAALDAYDPRYAIFVGTNVNPADSLTAWLPYLKRLDERFALITHHTTTVDEVDRACRAAGLTVPIVFRPKFRGLEKALTTGMTAAFYVHNSLLNNQMVSRRELNHVLLNHRESESPDNWSPMAAMYDQVFVPGRVARERFVRHDIHIPDSKFRVVGRPQVGAVQVRTPRPGDAPPVVLYAPTWFRTNGSRSSSLPHATTVVTALLARGVTVVLRPDVTSSRYRECREAIARVTALLDADREATGRRHRVATKATRRTSLIELMNDSDALISDTVYHTYDYLRSDKPFAVLSPSSGADAQAPVVAAAYRFTSDGSDADTVLDELLGTDRLARVRARVREDYLGPAVDDADQAGAFLAAARLAMAGRPAAATDRDMAAEEE